MDDLGALFLWGCAVGGSLAVGALVAAFVRLPERWAALLTALGGGLLLTAIGIALLVATVLGGIAFADASDGLVGTAQAVAAGAVLRVMSVAVIPHAFEEVSAKVAIATALGFTAGYLLA